MDVILLLATLAQAEPVTTEPVAHEPPVTTEVFGPELPPQSPVDLLPVEVRPVVEPPVVVIEPPDAPLLDIVPRVKAGGWRRALALGLVGGVFAMGAAGLRRLNRHLKPTGVFPATVRTIEVVVRVLVVFFGLSALGSLVPASIAPALPIVVMAAAVAVGWSARDVVQDLIAGLFITIEGQLRAGYWIAGERYSGSIEALGLRVTWLRDVHGRRIVVPNRILLAQPLVTDDKPWPRIQFRVALPVDAPTRAIRRALEEAILLSPWVAPEPEMEVHPDALDHSIWHVAVRVLDSRFAHRFQGLLRERVEEILQG